MKDEVMIGSHVAFYAKTNVTGWLFCWCFVCMFLISDLALDVPVLFLAFLHGLCWLVEWVAWLGRYGSFCLCVGLFEG